MRAAILFYILFGVLVGLLAAYVFRRRPTGEGWRCRNDKCGAVVARAGGKFCPACGTPRLPPPASPAAQSALPAAPPGGTPGNG